MTSLLPFPELQFFSNDGTPLAGGSVATFIPATSTPKATYQDAAGTVTNANPVILDSAGRGIFYGGGDYRFVVKDASANLIYDRLTSASLPDDAISAVMLPVCGAATLATARDLMGITAAINAAVATAATLTGPTGPTGATGVTGPTGAAGGAGAGYQPTLNSSNPGLMRFPNANGTATNIFIQFGSAVTDSSGNSNVTFATPFPTGILAVTATAGATSWWANVTAKSTSAFSVTTSSPLHGGGWPGAMSYDWIAIGY